MSEFFVLVTKKRIFKMTTLHLSESLLVPRNLAEEEDGSKIELEGRREELAKEEEGLGKRTEECDGWRSTLEEEKKRWAPLEFIMKTVELTC